MAKRGHRAFAAVYEKLAGHENEAMKRLRRLVAGQASGHVLEVGVGVGTNWAYLPAGVEYVGIDPDEYMLERAARAATREGRPVDLRKGSVEALPFEPGTFDTVISTLTFCSVEDTRRGLEEVLRVLKPGGRFLFSEHVRADSPAGARVQSAIKPLTRSMAGGCEWDRDTGAAIQAAGFSEVEFERSRLGVMPMITGWAVK